jgi:hypothetical protein
MKLDVSPARAFARPSLASVTALPARLPFALSTERLDNSVENLRTRALSPRQQTGYLRRA